METPVTSVDLSTVESYLLGLYEQGERIELLLAQNTELIAQVYTACLFGIGVSGALLVIYVLYSFLRKFY